MAKLDRDKVRKEFGEVVNMVPAELERRGVEAAERASGAELGGPRARVVVGVDEADDLRLRRLAPARRVHARRVGRVDPAAVDEDRRVAAGDAERGEEVHARRAVAGAAGQHDLVREVEGAAHGDAPEA